MTEPEHASLDARRRRLLFRATHRGTYENDILLGGFVQRHIAVFDDSEIAALEALIGDCLEEFGYPLTNERRSSASLDATLSLMRILYPPYFDAKLFLQSNTVVGRLTKGTRLELTDPV